MTDDPDFDLARFETAQETIYGTAMEELRKGRKRTHWMWYVFPQFAGLGHSSTAKRYAIGSVAEAKAFWAHGPLQRRLRRATELVLSHRDRPIEAIFGDPDYLKFRSCMTLFGACVGVPELFQAALDAFFDGEPDERTLSLLQERGSGL